LQTPWHRYKASPKANLQAYHEMSGRFDIQHNDAQDNNIQHNSK
jgi:hypothetical protein